MNSDLLTNLGLSEKSAQVYVAALSLGTSSVQTLAKKSGLKRPTAYSYIEELLQEGLSLANGISKMTCLARTKPRATRKICTRNVSSGVES